MRADQEAAEIPHRLTGVLLPRCRLCEAVPSRGIAGGYLVGKGFLCSECETAITRLEAGSEDYEVFVKRIKKLWK
ncbi:MAG: sigma factor G inhibitor Gin [Chitinophagales bacterium]